MSVIRGMVPPGGRSTAGGFDGIHRDSGSIQAFAHEFRRLSIALVSYGTRQSEPGSRAALDAAERAYDGPWGRAGRDVELRLRPWVSLAGDHIRATAAAIREPKVIVAPLTLSRAALESMAMAFWFYDPTQDLAERTRRHLNLRLRHIAERANLDGLDVQYLETESGWASAAAAALGLDYTPSRWRQERWLPARLGQPIPSAMSLFDELVIRREDGSSLGGPIYRLYSATAHGGDHTLGMYLSSPTATSDPGVVHAAYSIELPRLATLLSPLPLAAEALMTRLSGYAGWSIEPWNLATRPVMAAVQTWMLARDASTP